MSLGIVIPGYGRFLETPDKMLEDAKPFTNLTEVKIDESNPGLEEVVTVTGASQIILGKALQWGVAFVGLGGALNDNYRFVSAVKYGEGRKAAIRKTTLSVWDLYIARELYGNEEGGIVADGVIAPHWAIEGVNRVAVIDGIWPAELRDQKWPWLDNDNRSKKALLDAIEHQTGKDHRLIRCCREEGIIMDFLFYIGNGYRLFKRYDNELVMAKVLNPNFDTKLLKY